MNWRYLLPLAAVALLVAALGIGLRLEPGAVPSPLIGKPAPDFELPTVADADARLSEADLQGGIAVFNVWASWCVTCRVEHPLLTRMAKLEGVRLYGLNYKDKRADAQAWLRQYGNPYRASAYDPQGKVGIDWGVYKVPETFVLDAKGRIRMKHLGAISENDLEDKFLPLFQRLRAEQGA